MLSPKQTLTLLLILFGLLGCQLRPMPAPSVTPMPSASSGQLAYIGGDGNIYLTDAARSQTIALTNDATVAYEGQGLSYQRLAWSPEGRLAYASVLRQGGTAQSNLYVVDQPGAEPRLVGQSDDHFVIYLHWSPAACPDRPDCRHLAYLIEEDSGIVLRLVTLDTATSDNRALGVGRPFYFSWAADGRSIIGHTNYNRPQAQLSRYYLDRASDDPLPHLPGNFLAPAWSPRGDRWLGVVRTGLESHLQSFGQDETATLTIAADGDVAFVWSPDGRRVAYALRGFAADPFYGPIHLVDIATGQTRRLTDVGLRILAFFWSPDGQHLGYLTRQVLPETDWMQWRVYTPAGDTDRGFASFQPSPQMRFIIASFAQYAQSHRFWSPDSRYLVYGAETGLMRQVWLVDTWAEQDRDSLLVAEGSMGFWSW